MNYINAVILGIVEGLTEFLPVSSTGHLIVAGHLLGLRGDSIATFEIFIQLGAILSVAVLYRHRFLGLFDFKSREGFAGYNGLLLLSVTTLPALLFGYLAHGFIKEKLFNSVTVSLGLGLGGFAILLVERFLPQVKKRELESLNLGDAFFIGLFQCCALWPGMSRSASTILGAMLLGVDRKTAAEYSFFAAVPVISAATIYDLYKSRDFLSAQDVSFFSLGFVVSFIFAYFSIKFFIKLVESRTLIPFGIYRILISPIIFITAGRLP